MRITALLILSILLIACDEVEIESSISGNEPSQLSQSTQPPLTFSEKYDVYLTGKEVQYNMENNIDKDFVLDGTLSLCDYFNYGYKNQQLAFCGKLTPSNGDDSWYLYFSRETFAELYEMLLKNDVEVDVLARISSSNYKSGQGNMALVKLIEFK